MMLAAPLSMLPGAPSSSADQIGGWIVKTMAVLRSNRIMTAPLSILILSISFQSSSGTGQAQFFELIAFSHAQTPQVTEASPTQLDAGSPTPAPNVNALTTVQAITLTPESPYAREAKDEQSLEREAEEHAQKRCAKMYYLDLPRECHPMEKSNYLEIKKLAASFADAPPEKQAGFRIAMKRCNMLYNDNPYVECVTRQLQNYERVEALKKEYLSDDSEKKRAFETSWSYCARHTDENPSSQCLERETKKLLEAERAKSEGSRAR